MLPRDLDDHENYGRDHFWAIIETVVQEFHEHQNFVSLSEPLKHDNFARDEISSDSYDDMKATIA